MDIAVTKKKLSAIIKPKQNLLASHHVCRSIHTIIITENEFFICANSTSVIDH